MVVPTIAVTDVRTDLFQILSEQSERTQGVAEAKIIALYAESCINRMDFMGRCERTAKELVEIGILGRGHRAGLLKIRSALRL